MIRSLLQRIPTVISAPAIVAAAAALATAGVFILQTALDGAKGELDKTQQEIADARAELDVVTSLLAQARKAETETEISAVLEAVDGAGLYPTPEDVDPLDRAEATA